MKRIASSALVLLSVLSCAVGTAAGEGWSGAELIDAGTGDASYPDVAFGGDGSAIAVFYQSEGADWRVHAARYTPGDGWGAAAAIDAGPGLRSHSPRVACDTAGNAIAVFTKWDGSHWYTRAVGYSVVSGWGDAVTVDDPVGNNSLFPQIGCDSGGNAIVVFKQHNGSAWRMYANRFVYGTGWTGAGVIDTGSGEDASFPQVAVSPNGDAVAVFTQSDGSRTRAYANSCSPGAGWEGAVAVGDGGADVKEPRVAIDADGNAIAVFVQEKNGTPRAHASRRPSGSGWAAPVIIDAGAGYDAYSAWIAVNAEGEGVALVRQNDGSAQRLYSNSYEPGSGWDGAVVIDAATGGNTFEPAIGLGGNGNAMAVFSQWEGSRVRVYANIREPGRAWDGAEAVDAGPVHNVDHPRPAVAVNADGNAIAVFAQSDGSYQRVHANLYEPADPVIDLTLNKNSFSSADSIAVTADVQRIETPFYPFVRVVTPDGRTLYLVRGEGLTTAPSPYLRGGPFVLGAPIAGYPVVSGGFSGIAPGVYLIEGGAVDATRTTSPDNIVYIGEIDDEVATVN